MGPGADRAPRRARPGGLISGFFTVTLTYGFVTYGFVAYDHVGFRHRSPDRPLPLFRVPLEFL
ncbi:hypothetical protein GCM10010521_45380 [Streptomyces rameus]|uniref:Uncharacterized protein n=1 Tax=Streptomyces rameus TaxID=68261 RepID=A0ABP6NLX3_9ACTN